MKKTNKLLFLFCSIMLATIIFSVGVSASSSNIGCCYAKDGDDLQVVSCECDSRYNIYIGSTAYGYDVTSVGDSAFENTSTMTSVVFENGIVSLGSALFEGADNLKYVEIPDSVTEIADAAFDYVKDDIVICASSTSYAATYASKNGITRIDPHEHVLSADSTEDRAVSCSLPSLEHRRCTVVGCPYCEYTKGTDFLPHTASNIWVIEKVPTCTSVGKQVQYCTVCDNVARVQWLPRAKHTPSNIWERTKIATCSQKGAEVMKCSICKEVIDTRSIDCVEHTPGSWIVSKEPTETESGSMIQYCQVCHQKIRTKTIAPLHWDNYFTDVSEEAWYFNAVKWVNRNSVMDGVSANSFAPDAILTRAQLIKIFYNYIGKPEVTAVQKEGIIDFTDVDEHSWYSDAIAWAYSENIIAGTSLSTASPNQPVTREQCAQVLYNYCLKYLDNDNIPSQSLNNGISDFADCGDVSVWARAAMDWAVMNKFIVGNTDGLLMPKAAATRAQAATIISNPFA